jgi:hypothetical protein
MYFPVPACGNWFLLDRLLDKPCGDSLHARIEIGAVIELMLAAQVSQLVIIENLRLGLHRIG